MYNVGNLFSRGKSSYRKLPGEMRMEKPRTTDGQRLKESNQDANGREQATDE